MSLIKLRFKIAAINIFWIISSSGLLVKASPLPDKILIGIRTGAERIGKLTFVNSQPHWDGYCKEFSDELKSQLQKNGQQNVVNIVQIYNENRNKSDFPRYDGLKKKIANTDQGRIRETTIDIECGPNSIPKDKEKWKWVLFSDPFLEGVKKKLLLNIDAYTDLMNTPPSERINFLKREPIGVLEDTNTEDVFKNADYNMRIYKTRVLLIEGLKTGLYVEHPTRAYANDVSILETDHEVNLKRNNKFMIYPASGSLPGIDSSTSYAIAISRHTSYSGELLGLVNNTVNSPELKKTAKAIKESQDFKEPSENNLHTFHPQFASVFIALALVLAFFFLPASGRTKIIFRFLNNAVNISKKIMESIFAKGL